MISIPSASTRRRRVSPKLLRRLALLASVALALWAGAGIRGLDVPGEYGVVEGPIPGLFPMRVTGSLVFAPPGIFRFARYPRGETEVPLPRAAEAMLRRSDGGRFGLEGSALLEIQEDAWRKVHEAAGGDGLRGVLRSALRAAEGELPVGTLRQGALEEPLLREIEARILGRLAERGVLLHRLKRASLDLLEVAEVPARGRRPAPDTRLLVIGLDGADWAVLDPLLAQGRLPNLERLIRNGVRAKLRTITPTLSPVVWTTIATGVEPNRHGVLDFLVPAADGGAGEPVTSAQRRVPTVWEMLSEAGLPVGVVGWWATWPADPVRGYLVSDRLAYQLFGIRSDVKDPAGKTWPEEVYSEIRPLLVTPESVLWEEVLPYLEGPRRRPEQFDREEVQLLDDFRTLLASGRTYLEVALELRRREDVRFEAVYFEGTDTVAHLFAPYRPPRLPGVSSGRYDSFRAIVDRYYETADRQIGRLLEGRDARWTVVVLSDHGFATDDTRPRSTDSRIGHGAAADWHRKFGVLVFSGARVAAGHELEEASVYDVAPTLLALFGQPIPVSWRGRVLAAALEPAFLDAHPVTFQRDEPKRGAPSPGGEDPAGSEALLAKLRSLGYIGSGARPAATTRNNVGVALLAEGKFREAADTFRAALGDQPTHPQLGVNLGIALRFAGEREEARRLFEGGLRYPSSRRVSGLQLAQMSLEAGDLDEAERFCQLVLEVEPRAAEVSNTLGLVLEKRDRLAAAAAAFRRAAEADPHLADPRNNLGNLAKGRGDLAEAERWYRQAIEADPYALGAYNNLALIHQEKGELEKAIGLYARALEKAPGNAVVLNNLGSLSYAKGDMAEARRLWHQASRADPSYPSPLNNLAGIEIAAGRLEAAEELLRRALELAPDYGDARINLALVERARGRTGAARAELEKARRDPASRAAALTQLGLLLMGEGKVEEALAPLEEARGIASRTSTLNALGTCYRRLGRRAQAEQAWRASLDLDPRQDTVRRSLAELGP